ncbi:hypothetical protein [Nocardia blacklockiae]|uniref:hypothetical protein n=1 Tax=Nocardia blacklockiae TaxID=480036 RepID=UPI0018939816|nr:hypothetical protein [Nocardia blacklockiae]MBF6176554.1 hypothetical protein [Nocardia blacklockiae]
MVLSSRRARQSLVWLHVVTSVGWASMAVALGVLLATGTVSPPGLGKSGPAHAADLLDRAVLVPAANAAAVTGFLLAACTSFGYFQRRWVTAKFVLTLGQLAVGIAVLSPRMPEIVTAADAGRRGPVAIALAGAVVMGAGLAFQAWVSFVKPWGRTSFGERGPRLHNAPAWLMNLAVAGPLTDLVLGVVVGAPPLFGPIVLVVALVRRAWARRLPRLRPAAAVA